MGKTALSKIIKETQQDHSTRVALIEEIEKSLDNRKIIAFFTSFHYPVGISDGDAVMLEGILQQMNLNSGLTLIISSPGGDGLASERIVNVCRSYSKGNFEVIIPGLAKSAATMICFGANQILMSKTSELGPIDMQITLSEDGQEKVFSVYDILNSYQTLFNRAVRAKGNLEPYILQLKRFDEREIEKFTRYKDLSEDIAIKLLKQSMMSRLSESEIKKKIQVFLYPTSTKVHGRPIFIDEARKSGLKILELDVNSTLWHNIQEYAARLTFLMQRQCMKIIESSDDVFSQNIPNEN